MWIFLKWIGRILINKNMTIKEKGIWIKYMICKFCNIKAKWSDVIRSEDNPIDGYDCYYCLECDIWLEPKCNDVACEFCDKRPERPSMAERR